MVTVRFDANVMPNLGWTFRPMQTEMKVRIGETSMAFYEAVNTSDETVTGTASYNVSPDTAGYFFEKIACFCFTEQTLAPGERIEMPLTFFVSPDMVESIDRVALWNLVATVEDSILIKWGRMAFAQTRRVGASPSGHTS